MAKKADHHHASFELTFRPNVRLINVVRRFVSDFYDQVIGDADTVSRLALATHELLENAVRYSADGETRVRIDVDPGDGTLTIRMANRAEPAHRAALTELLAEMEGAPDAMDHYCTLMRRNAKRKDGSGLGLARIHAEAEMSLGCEMSGDRVTIIAKTGVAERGDT